MWEAILFDLDGTLLLSNEEEFYRIYFSMLGDFCKDILDPTSLIATIQTLVKKLSSNPNGKSNYEKFMDGMKEEFGIEKAQELEIRFNEFYSTRFKELESLTSPNEKLIRWMRALETKKVLATNPIFPKKAIVERLRWAGLEERNFDLITTMENFSYSKPQKEYYLEIAKRLKTPAQSCLMVGNDLLLDGSCTKVGMDFKHVEEF